MKPLLSFLIIIVLTSCSTYTTEKSPNRDDLYRALDSFNLAFEKGDISQLASMITDNYVHTNGSWRSFGKEKWLGYMRDRKAKIEQGDLIIHSYSTQEVDVQWYGQSAIVTAKITSSGIEDGLAFSKEFRVTNIWVYEGQRWKRAGFHDTPIDNRV